MSFGLSARSDDRDLGPVSQVTKELSDAYHCMRDSIVETLQDGSRKRALYGFVASGGCMPALAVCAAGDAIAVVQSGLPSQRASASAAPATATAAAAGVPPQDPCMPQLDAQTVSAETDDYGYHALVTVRRALATRISAPDILRVAEQLDSSESPLRKRARVAVNFAHVEVQSAGSDAELDMAHQTLMSCLPND